MKAYGRYRKMLSTWGIPAVYAGVAMTAALTLPRFEGRIFPGVVAPVSVSAASAIYSSIASGMIALTGIVFSLSFVMVQFSATAYSPRLVLWIARDPVMSHALGIFTATFLFAIGALAGIDRGGSGQCRLSARVEIGLLLASVSVFVALIHRISCSRSIACWCHGRPGARGHRDNVSIVAVGGCRDPTDDFVDCLHPGADSSRQASLDSGGRCCRAGAWRESRASH
jgi:hypothetical protein